jgi:hypothetical protein
MSLFSANQRFRCKICNGLLVPPNELIGVFTTHCPAHPRADIVYHPAGLPDIPEKPETQMDLFK